MSGVASPVGPSTPLRRFQAFYLRTVDSWIPETLQRSDPETLRRSGFDELRRRIREEEPPRPSTRVSGIGADSDLAAQRRRTDSSSRRSIRHQPELTTHWSAA